MPSGEFLHLRAGSNLQKKRESFFTLHYNIYSETQERKRMSSLGLRENCTRILERKRTTFASSSVPVQVLLMNIDRYDPVFECCGVRKLGSKPIEPFELKADMSSSQRRKIELVYSGALLKGFLRVPLLFTKGYKRDAHFCGACTFKMSLVSS